jgi:hypothetical protein
MSAEETLRIRVDDEPHATQLAAELAQYGPVEIRPHLERWEVALDQVRTSRVVAAALDAVQRSLDGEATLSAEVFLDGREYRMHGEA